MLVGGPVAFDCLEHGISDGRGNSAVNERQK
jgi:hypothetical protein